MRQYVPSVCQYLPSAATTRGVVAAVVLGTAFAATDARALASSQTARSIRSDDGDSEAVRDITRYCQACWRNARLPEDRWADCTQQVLVRLLERLPMDRWSAILVDDGEDKRELVRAIDTVKKRAQRSKRYGELVEYLADAKPAVPPHLDDWDAVNAAAERVLSERQKAIVELSAAGWGVPDIAGQLGTTAERISDEKYKAIRKLRSELVAE